MSQENVEMVARGLRRLQREATSTGSSSTLDPAVEWRQSDRGAERRDVYDGSSGVRELARWSTRPSGDALRARGRGASDAAIRQCSFAVARQGAAASSATEVDRVAHV